MTQPTSRMDPGVFGQVITAMVTPMTDIGGVDLDGAARLASALLELGNDALVLNGTTGESPTTSDAEKSDLIRAVRAAVGPDVRLTAGVGTNHTAHSVELARQAEDAGADALLVVTPYYSKPSQDGVLAHFLAVAEATELPVMIYDIPGRSAIPATTETLLRAAEHPRIQAVKDAKADLQAATEVLRGSDLQWFSGDDALNLPFLSIGATGFVSVTGHLIADRLRDMAAAFFAGDMATAQRLFYSTAPITTGLFRVPAVTLTKAALDAQGLPAGPPRLPLLPASTEQQAQLRTDLADGGLILAGNTR
jgi:4-hydroxy-tetrahydrodipicolinate synthase